MKSIVSIAVFAGLVLSLTPVHAQVTVSGDQSVVNFSDPSRPGLLRVNWNTGSISVRSHAGKDVIVRSRAFDNRGRGRPAQDLNASRLSVEENNNVISITRGSGSPADLEIEVPVKTNLNIKALNGRAIVAEGIEGEIEVSSTNADVRLTNVSGSVIADSTNGNVIVSLRDMAPVRSMSFASMNGNVDVTLPSSTKANLRIQVQNGDAITEFEILLRPTLGQEAPQNRGRSSGRTTIGTINGGGTELALRTLNGNIYIRKAK
jgi:DUF4097 and DUF4098 domain-containing protein YvlB